MDQFFLLNRNRFFLVNENNKIHYIPYGEPTPRLFLTKYIKSKFAYLVDIRMSYTSILKNVFTKLRSLKTTCIGISFHI